MVFVPPSKYSWRQMQLNGGTAQAERGPAGRPEPELGLQTCQDYGLTPNRQVTGQPHGNARFTSFH